MTHPEERYTGFTTHVEERLKKHNDGGSPHTAKFRPWKLVAYFAFEQKETAIAFERYLKSGSGRAFAKRHLWAAG